MGFGSSAFAGGWAQFVPADEVSSSADLIASVDESTFAQDSAAVLAASVLASVQENISAADAFVTRFFWADVVNTQVPEWRDVLSLAAINGTACFGDARWGDVSYAGSFYSELAPPAPTWSAVVNNTPVNWTDVPALPIIGAVWADVDNTQTVVWVDINAE